jgi:hypothetical protein
MKKKKKLFLILHLGIYLPEGMGYSKEVYTSTFISALFTIAKLWKEPRYSFYSTADEWIKEMWYLHTMELYSATKKNEILSSAGKWMQLENIILNEVSQDQKAKSCMFSLTCGI